MLIFVCFKSNSLNALTTGKPFFLQIYLKLVQGGVWVHQPLYRVPKVNSLRRKNTVSAPLPYAAHVDLTTTSRFALDHAFDGWDLCDTGPNSIGHTCRRVTMPAKVLRSPALSPSSLLTRTLWGARLAP